MTVTAIIPFYNSEATLHRAIDSILQQSQAPIEIILVDNNSTDRSPEIADRYVREFPDLFILINESTQGANFARNTGLSRATGEWIQFLDSDDQLRPEKLSHQQELIRQHPEIDMIIASNIVYMINQEGTKIEYTKRIETDPVLGLIRGLAGTTCSNLWKRSGLDRIGGFNTEHLFVDDPLLVFDFVQQKAGIYFDHEPLVVVYQNMNIESISRSNDAGVMELQLRDIYFLFRELAKYIALNFPENRTYSRALEIQKYLIYRNYRYNFNTRVPDFLPQIYTSEHIQPHLLTNLKSYYYYLVNSKLRHNGFLKYPDLMLQALLNIGKLLS